jgi:hypothetical protein
MTLDATCTFRERRHNLLTIEIAAPGAGNPVNFTVPANTCIQVIGFDTTFSTDATAQDRLVRCYVRDTTPLNTLYSYANLFQPALRTWTYCFAVGLAPLEYTAAPFLLQQNPLACAYQLKSAGIFRIDAVNGVAADAFGTTRIRYFAWTEG